MRVGHFDASFGIAGDMALAALLDAGASKDAVAAALTAVGIAGLRLEPAVVQRAGIRCLSVAVRWDGDGMVVAGHHDQPHPHHPHRPYGAIRDLLRRAPLSTGCRQRAEAVFARLAEAEATIHGTPVESVALHEVGAEDAIGDIVGVAAALDALGIERLTACALPVGGGTIVSAHGTLPIPAPAVALLLRGWPLIPGPVSAELVTPTGAAILTALAQPAERWPALRLDGTGWGAGRRDYPHHPNACRFSWGTAGFESAETLYEVETHIDDQTAEQLAYCCERLWALGALDVATTPIGMKKGRTGIRLWALARRAELDAMRACMFAETSALGVRVRAVERWSLERAPESVQTPYGRIVIKVARNGEHVLNAAPEYEDCARLARQYSVPLKAIMAAALAAWTAAQPPA